VTAVRTVERPSDAHIQTSPPEGTESP
jgi:hypothetical protein